MVQSVNVHAQDFQEQLDGVVAFDTGNKATSGAGLSAVVTLAADTNVPNIISQIVCSYSATPAGGNLKIEDVSGTSVFDIDLVGTGPFVFNFVPALANAVKNSALIITLAAPGGAVVGKLWVNARKHV